MPTGFTVPLGTIAIWRKHRQSVRKIKVRMDGPISGRWIHYARWWWEKNKGRIPPGKRVCHLDGDTLNDDPTGSNYGLLTPGDVAFIWHDRYPGRSRENYRKCRDATAKFNRLRGAVNRQQRWLPSQWYPVDPDRQVIHNTPHRKAWQVYAQFGLPGHNSNGQGMHSAAMGWPGVILASACILHVLSREGPLPAAELLGRLNAMRQLRGWPPIIPESIPSIVCAAGGRILHKRFGPYEISTEALAARTPACPVFPLRGRDLARSEFQFYKRNDAPQSALAEAAMMQEALCSEREPEEAAW